MTLLIYLAAIATLHFIAETKFRLCDYFADTTGFVFLRRLPTWAGALLIAAPAYALQMLCIIMTYRTHDARWLLGVAGLSIGDALFSHLIPELKHGASPGGNTAIIYLVNGVAIVVMHRPEQCWPLLPGLLFFLSVQPTLRFIGKRIGN